MNTVLIWVWLLLASSPFPTADAPAYQDAHAQRECAPWDGPAVGIYLTTEKQSCGKLHEPYLAIAIYSDVSKLSGRTIELGTHTGSARRCDRPNTCEAAESGQVGIERIGEKGEIYGHYELHFKKGATEKAAFKAEWCSDRALCG